ncbi:unnamed protein product, partial [Amoebophrya sp. A25]
RTSNNHKGQDPDSSEVGVSSSLGYISDHDVVRTTMEQLDEREGERFQQRHNLGAASMASHRQPEPHGGAILRDKHAELHSLSRSHQHVGNDTRTATVRGIDLVEASSGSNSSDVGCRGALEGEDEEEQPRLRKKLRRQLTAPTQTALQMEDERSLEHSFMLRNRRCLSAEALWAGIPRHQRDDGSIADAEDETAGCDEEDMRSPSPVPSPYGSKGRSAGEMLQRPVVLSEREAAMESYMSKQAARRTAAVDVHSNCAVVAGSSANADAPGELHNR